MIISISLRADSFGAAAEYYLDEGQSVEFQPGNRPFTPNMLAEERKFVNDPVLVHSLKLIGQSGVILNKLVVGFTGRGEVNTNDVAFMRALTSISGYKVVKTCAFGHSRIGDWLWSKARNFIEHKVSLNLSQKGRAEV